MSVDDPGALHILEAIDGPTVFCGGRAAAYARAPMMLERVSTLSRESLIGLDICRECVAQALVRFAGAAATAATVLWRLDGEVR